MVVSPNRVHVSFNTDATTTFTNPGDVITRDKLNGVWQTPQPVVTGPTEQQSLDERLLVYGNYLYLFYNRYNSNYNISDDLVYKRRLVGETSWSAFPPIEYQKLNKYENAFEVTKTTNNNFIHILCKKFIYPGSGWCYTYKYYDGENWITGIEEFDYPSVSGRRIGLSSVSNDLFCTWVKSGTPYLRFRQYDAIPLAPTNLTSFLDPNPSCNTCHGSGPGIRLDWAKNNEPDLSYYTIYRSEGTGCNSCHGSGSSSPPDSTSSAIEPVTVSKECPALQGEITDFQSSKVEVETGCLSGLAETEKLIFEPIWAWVFNYWVDMNIREDYTYLYFVTAKDATSHESGQSAFTSTYVPPGSFNKIFSNFSREVVPKIYLLYQNFPNPFNPETTIRYQLPEPAFVTLEIFNCLGQKVKTLVNEFKAEGYYSVVWDSKDDYNHSLPSGIYYYRLTTDEFTSSRKLVLLK